MKHRLELIHYIHQTRVLTVSFDDSSEVKSYVLACKQKTSLNYPQNHPDLAYCYCYKICINTALARLNIDNVTVEELPSGSFITTSDWDFAMDGCDWSKNGKLL